MQQTLLRAISSQVQLTEKQLENISQRFKVKKTVKNEIILHRGAICRELFFVNSGYIRAFVISATGEEATRFVAFEGEFGTAMPSFVSQKPSLAFIDTPEESELLCISHAGFYSLLEEVPKMEKFYRHVLEDAYVESVKRLEDFITMDAFERYQSLLKNKPQVFKRLSNRNVASYLGISQETLSRIKSKA